MGRGEHIIKKDGIRNTRRRIQRFLERSFDWIALLLIALIILLTLVFF